MNPDKAARGFEIARNPGAVEGAYVETFSSNLARLLFYSIGLPTHYVGDQLLLVILKGEKIQIESTIEKNPF